LKRAFLPEQHQALRRDRGDPYMWGMKNLELLVNEAAALMNLLKRAIVADRYPLSPRVRAMVGILTKLRPQPARPVASPAPRAYAPSSASAAWSRGGAR
jgi:hypothetical protein